jgi:hypothetical protein
MSDARLLFHNELRSAVSDARAAAPVRVMRSPAPATPARKRTVIALWLPLTPVWILLAPLALLAAPALAISRETRGMPPYKTAFMVGAVLLSMSGTVIDITAPDAVVRLRIF